MGTIQNIDHSKKEGYPNQGNDNDVSAITFGEPIVANPFDKDLLTTFWQKDNQYYSPPISFDKLCLAARQNAVLESATFIRRNAILRCFIENEYISRETFEAISLDYELTGNLFIHKLFSDLGNMIRLKHLNVRSMRRTKKGFCFLKNKKHLVNKESTQHALSFNEVIHGKSYGTESSIYGLPQHISILQAVYLGSDAEMFKRKFYQNGAHIGNIVYMHHPGMKDHTFEALKKEIQDTKGNGNLKSILVVNRSAGDNLQFKVEPVGSTATADDFIGVTKVSNEKILIVKRIPASMIGIVPGSGTHFGDQRDSQILFYYNEVDSMQHDYNAMLLPHLPKGTKLFKPISEVLPPQIN